MSYDTVASMRDEGVADPPYDDPRVQVALDIATLQIDTITGQFFEPRDIVLLLDGRGHDTMYVGVPIVSVTKVETGHGSVWTEVDLDSVDVYNRHISGQTHPDDDRSNPRIVRTQATTYPVEFLDRDRTRIRWVKGTQNVRVTGRFGYTDWDGVAADGVTPELVRWACRKLALKELPGMADEEWDELHERSRVLQEKTRDQSITLAKPYIYDKGGAGYGVLTGDATVDAVLRRFMRPLAARGV